MVTKTWVKGMLTRFFNKLHKVAISGDYNDLENKLVVNITALNPTGTIINFFGLETQVPEGYLPCNGAEYLIEDYPILANHLAEIDTSLSRTDYVGSDAEHFKVPDLRGEFLRGTGTNSHAYSGSGAGVGVHQVPTSVPEYWYTDLSDNRVVLTPWTISNQLKNSDSYRDNPAGRLSAFLDITPTKRHDTTTQQPYAYTTRPTNTSVLYCIKY